MTTEDATEYRISPSLFSFTVRPASRDKRVRSRTIAKITKGVQNGKVDGADQQMRDENVCLTR